MHQGKDLLCDYQVNSGRSSSAQWPGYEHLNWSFSTPASSSMTLVQLGASIAMHFWRFVEVGDSLFTNETDPTDSVSRKLCHLRPRPVGGRLVMKI